MTLNHRHHRRWAQVFCCHPEPRNHTQQLIWGQKFSNLTEHLTIKGGKIGRCVARKSGLVQFYCWFPICGQLTMRWCDVIFLCLNRTVKQIRPSLCDKVAAAYLEWIHCNYITAVKTKAANCRQHSNLQIGHEPSEQFEQMFFVIP